jgi:hypothetical protein
MCGHDVSDDFALKLRRIRETVLHKMSEAPHSPSSNIVTAVLDRLVAAGWVQSYVADAQYHIRRIDFTDEGWQVLSPMRKVLDTLGPMSDDERAALAWIICHIKL